MAKLNDKQYEDIGRIVVHGVLTNRKVNRALSQSPYGMRIALIANAKDYGNTVKPQKKQSFIQKLISWIRIKKS